MRNVAEMARLRIERFPLYARSALSWSSKSRTQARATGRAQARLKRLAAAPASTTSRRDASLSSPTSTATTRSSPTPGRASLLATRRSPSTSHPHHHELVNECVGQTIRDVEPGSA